MERALAFGGGAVGIWAVLVLVLLLTNIISKKSLFTSPSKNSILSSSLVALAPLFIIYIYLPAETFFHSYSDYNFPYWIILKSQIIEFVCLWYTLTYFIGILNKKAARVISALVLGFTLAIYVQYMFFNQNVGIVDGHPFKFTEHMVLASVNIIVWLLLLVVPVVIAIKGNKKSGDNNKAEVGISSKISAAVLALHILTFAMLLISADKECYHYSSVYFDFSEQYTVGSGKNIVLFIIDEADNNFMKQLYQEGKISPTFDDYIMYTNTCSVYDFTNLSMLQMVTNYPFDNTLDAATRRELAWSQESVVDFYDRFHQAGYKVNFFNFDYETSDGVLGNMDNACKFDEKTDTIQYINYKNIKKQSDALVAYRVLPIVLKPTVDMTLVSSPDPVIIYSTDTGYYENKDFNDNMELKLGDSENYLIIHHIKGLHMPDNNVETMDYCMGIVEKYIDQMKELGVYDNASIIITADHGSHDECEGDTWAATPMFMIRVAESNGQGPILSDAPIYHTDIMPTLLYEAGLYKESDVEVFGKTVFDYKDGDQRERTWYNRRYDPAYPKREKYNVYYGYTYTGNTETLEKMVDEGQQEVIPVPMKNE